MMDCARFETLLFAGLDAPVDAHDRAQMARHEQSCERCRRLAALAAGTDEPGLTEVPADFAATVVTRTIGSACAEAWPLLAAAADDPADAGELLHLHLATCADCAALARALAQLRRDLPALAEVDPGEQFVSAVMAATLGGRPSLPAKRRAGWSSAWQQLIGRPRLALEGACAAAILTLILFGQPSAALSEKPVRALDALSEWNASATDFVDRSAQDLWDGVLAPRAAELRSLWNEIARRSR
jgi:hypothetical protein